MGVTCNTLLGDMSTVKRRFDSTKVSAESEYVKALEDYYKIVEQKLQEEATTLRDTMLGKANRARRDVKKRHMEMLKKTDDNIEKLREKLEEVKKKKLELTETRGREDKEDYKVHTLQ